MHHQTKKRAIAFILGVFLLWSFTFFAAHHHAKISTGNTNCAVCTFAHTPVEAAQTTSLASSFDTITSLQITTESFGLIQLVFRESARAPPSA